MSNLKIPKDLPKKLKVKFLKGEGKYVKGDIATFSTPAGIKRCYELEAEEFVELLSGESNESKTKK